jgi:hypothetical protein
VTRDRRVVGFDRTLELAWLDATVGFVVQGLSESEVRKRVFAYLDGVVPGATNNSARGKTVTVLARIWSNVPASNAGFRSAAARAFSDAGTHERIAIHWAMMLAAYPYFLDAASHVGRLIRLHGEVEVPQLTRRLSASWGERELIQRTAQLVARSMSLWGVLQPRERAGTYTLARKPMKLPTTIVFLLAEALLIGIGRESVTTGEIEAHPALFPFDVNLPPGSLRMSDRFEVHRVGLDQEHVNLR